MDQVTQAKIDALLAELHSWGPGERRSTVLELAERFELQPWVIQRVAKSAGHELKVGEAGAPEEEMDSEAVTSPFELDLDGKPEKD